MYVCENSGQRDNNERNINNSELDKGPFGRLLSVLGVCVSGRVIVCVCAWVSGFPSRLSLASVAAAVDFSLSVLTLAGCGCPCGALLDSLGISLCVVWLLGSDSIPSCSLVLAPVSFLFVATLHSSSCFLVLLARYTSLSLSLMQPPACSLPSTKRRLLSGARSGTESGGSPGSGSRGRGRRGTALSVSTCTSQCERSEADETKSQRGRRHADGPCGRTCSCWPRCTTCRGELWGGGCWGWVDESKD